MLNGKQMIVNQSKRWLCEALITLMEDGKPYESITVKEISEKATLDRRTFYRHFKNKDYILKEYTMILFNDYLEVVIQNKPEHFKDVINIYFSFWNENIKLLKCLKRNGLFFNFVEQYNNLIEDVVADVLKIETTWHNYDSSIDSQYMSLYSIGGLWNVLFRWIDDDNRKSPREMSDILTKALVNFLN